MKSTSERSFLHLEQILLAKDVATQLIRDCPDHTKGMFLRFFDDQIERARARISSQQENEQTASEKQ